MAFADTQKLIVELDLKGNLRTGLRDAARAIQNFDKATSHTQQSLSKFGRNLERGIVIGAAAAAGAIGTVVRAASDYESAFAGVRKTVNATEPELQALSAAFRQMSKEIPISASELARLGEAGGALGVPTKQLKEFVRVTALLGVTTNLTADEAANSLGILGNVLHLTGAEYSKFASSLVALGNAGASTEADIVAIAERSGAAGHLIGLATEDILGFASATASLGIEAEAGGTALQKFFIDSTKMISAGGKDLREFAKVSGLSAKAFQKAFKDDAGGALQAFLKGLGKLPQAKQLAVLEDLGFNDARITRTLLGLANNTKLVSDQMGVANKAFAENTALTKEADQRFNTFDSQLKITKNTLTDMAITIGSKLLPKITPLLKSLNQFIGSNQDKISQFGDQLASAFESVANAVQKVDWQPFIEGLRISGDIAKTVIGAFRSLPADLQKLVIAGFALNKVTGGLGTSIAKDIGGALLGQFAQRGSSPANALWVQQVGGVGGAAGIAGASTSKLGKVASAAAKVFLVGAAVGVFAELKGILDTQSAQNKAISTGLSGQTQAFVKVAGIDQMKASLQGIKDGVRDGIRNDALYAAAYNLNIDGVRDTVEAQIRTLEAAITEAEGRSAAAQVHATERAEAIASQKANAIKTATDRSTLAIRRGEATENRNARAVTARLARVQAAAKYAGQQAAAAIKDKDLSVSIKNVIPLSVSVSSRELTTKLAIQNRYYKVPT